MQAEGPKNSHPIDDGYPLGTTNPIRVYVGDQPIRNPESAWYFIRWMDRLIQLAEVHPGWRSQKEKDYVLGQFREARAIYERLAR